MPTLPPSFPATDRARFEDKFVGGQTPDPLRGRAVRHVEVTYLDAHLHQPGVVEGGQPKLDRTGIVEAGVRLEIHMQPLSQRLQPLDALRPVEEGRGSRDEQVEVREPPSVDVVDQLPQGVQALLSHVAPDPLERLDLVEDEHQSREARVLEDQQQPPQEAQGGEVVHVPLDPGDPLDRCGDVRLTGEPTGQALGDGVVVLPLGRPVRPQGGGELRRGTGDLDEPLFQKFVGTLG